MDILLSKKLEEIKGFYPKEKDKELIQKAYNLAFEAHKSQKRESGEPYIIHPVDTALTIARIKLDSKTVAAAFLHDVVDDTDITLKEIEKEFGKEVAFLVEGVSKLGKIKYRGVERHAENLRKMLFATAQDVRVILIKFADRLHNMSTLESLPERKQKRIALETLDIYAPIASRLGLSEISKQLEDLAFPYIYPDEYSYIKNETNYLFKEAENYLKKLKPVIRKELAKENIRPRKIEMRAKHYYSLWKKLEKNDHNWSQIYDLVAVRIIVDSIEDCYKTLGVIHKLWKPLPGRIKDYIALPKPNGYQSLHTTVFALRGRITEIQIRTQKMHEQAEYGIAAHWSYKNKAKQSAKNVEKTYEWVKSLQEWKKETSLSEEFIENLKIDVFNDRIFVFTPNGDVIDLPRGATPVDFAYTIHSEVGDKCAAAIRNGKIVPLNYELHNGDVVEIITSKNKTPSQAWLGFVKTRIARNRIRAWFKKQDYEKNIEAGEQLINQELKTIEGKLWHQIKKDKTEEILSKLGFSNEEQLLVAVGRGDISPGRIAKLFAVEEEEESVVGEASSKSKSHGGITIAGISGIQAHIAKCCNPVRPEKIAAYITIDKGASIHKINCKNLHKPKRQEKILPAFWSGSATTTIVNLEILSTDRVGFLQDATKIIAEFGINIVNVASKKDEDGVNLNMQLEISSLNQLQKVAEKLKTIEGVINVQRKINS